MKTMACGGDCGCKGCGGGSVGASIDGELAAVTENPFLEDVVHTIATNSGSVSITTTDLERAIGVIDRLPGAVELRTRRAARGGRREVSRMLIAEQLVLSARAGRAARAVAQNVRFAQARLRARQIASAARRSALVRNAVATMIGRRDATARLLRDALGFYAIRAVP